MLQKEYLHPVLDGKDGEGGENADHSAQPAALVKNDEHRGEVELQKLTDGRVGDLDGVLKAKEEEILEV